MQRFLPFLPPGGGAGQDEEAVAATIEDLEYALSAESAEFWMVVRADASLLALADTYLRHAPRPFDDGFQALSGLQLTLWQHMLALLHRM
jgi:hypothetical protein